MLEPNAASGLISTNGARPNSSVAAPLAVERLEIKPAEVVGGESPGPKGCVTLSVAGVAGVTEVGLSTDKPSIVTVPSTVEVGEGEASAAFDIEVSGVAQPTATEITASVGAVSCSASLVVYPPPGAPTMSVVDRVPATEAAPVTDSAPSAKVATVEAAPVTEAAPKTEAALKTEPAPTVEPAPAPGSRQQPQQPIVAWQPVCPPSLGASLLSVLPALPFVALVFVVAIYVAPLQGAVLQIAQPLKPMPVLAGMAIAVVCMVLAALAIRFLMGGASADSSNAAVFGELIHRVGELDARLAALDSSTADGDLLTAQRRAQLLRSQLGVELQKSGVQWMLGAGYINAWGIIHRAEEALLAAESKTDLVSAALYDELRLAGSQIANSAALILKLRRAITQVNPAASLFLNQSSTPPVAETAPPAAGDGDAQGAARATLAEVRHTINAFRDDSWAGLVRSRNNLVIVLTACGFATLLLLIASMSVRPPAATVVSLGDPILSSSIFYVVGAIVGLLNRLYSEASSSTSVEDYGLTLARLSITPVLSGLAGVGGVLLVALVLSGAGGFGVNSPNAAATAARTLPTLADIFNLQSNQFGLIVAGVFGLTPHLLIATLQGQANQYMEAIKSTAAPASASSS